MDTRVVLLALLLAPRVALPAATAADFYSGGPEDAAVSYPTGESSYQLVEGCRFYSRVLLQPWRSHDDVVDGFDWSLPPGTRPASGSLVKGAPAEGYPGHRIEPVNTTWRELEPEEGRFDFSALERALARAEKNSAVVELHVRASVWDIETRDAAGKIVPRSGPWPGEISAPRWLQQVIPAAELLEARREVPGPGSRTLVNCDIFQPEYHRRYLRMVSALGQSPLARDPRIAVVFVHMVSGTGGEENDGASIHGPLRGPVVRERIKAWADAFGRDGHRLMFTGCLPENLDYCYRLGVGQRNGLIECYLLHTHHPALGQRMDADGHMIVDESLPPIAGNLPFGDENEEYATSGNFHVDRFGPRRTWNHRYREAALRALQMRRNYLWEPHGFTPDPYLSAYLALTLGRQVADSPDAWCYLRESYVHAQNLGRNPAVPVRNFERWLVQRDLPGEPTEAVNKVVTKDYPPAGNLYNCYVPGMNFDFTARRGRRFGFALDDRFPVDAQHPVAIKITYYDEQPWALVYPTKDGPRERSVGCRGDGTLRTATFFVPDALLTAQGDAPDFEIRATAAPATLRFVRVVRVADAEKLSLANFRDSLVPRGFVLSEPDWHIWCNAPILDEEGRVHLFVSRWPVKDTFGLGWHTSCEIAHYKADQPEGPYTYVSTVLKGSGVEGSWRKEGTHNVTVVRIPDGRYAMLFIANSHGTSGFPANQRIGMMLAASLDGPWTFAGQDGLILDVPADPAVWSHDSAVGVNNPTLLPMPDGRFLLYYKAMKRGKGEVRRMGVAVADRVEGPYRFEQSALTANEGTIEDGFAFLLNGEACLLVTDCHGEGYGGGMIYHSRDGLHFDPTPIRAFEAVDYYLKRWPNPAQGWSPWVLQRPALLLGPDGVPTHLFAPCGTPPENRNGTSTFLLEIKPGH